MNVSPTTFPELDPEVKDLDCIASLCAGDPDAIRPLVERWEKPLLAFVFRYTQDEHASRDIVQETFIRVYTHCQKFDARRGFPPWLFTIAANLCRNRHRWQRRHPEQSWEADASPGQDESAVADRIADPAATPAQALAREEASAALKRLVMSLPHDQRTAVLLHHYQGMSVNEIASIVGCSPRGVETRIYRALKRLRSAVSR